MLTTVLSYVRIDAGIGTPGTVHRGTDADPGTVAGKGLQPRGTTLDSCEHVAGPPGYQQS